MRYNKIRKMDISNGPGIRVSLFTQGCLLRCPECFNKDTWDPKGGKEFTKNDEILITNLCNDSHCFGLSVLGGEPLLEENLSALKMLFSNFRIYCPNKTIWLWTGYTIENMSAAQLEIFNMCDVVIDGPFINEKKNLKLYYAGSDNQRMWVKQENGLFVQKPIPIKE